MMERGGKVSMKKFFFILCAVILIGGLILSTNSMAAPAKVIKLTYALFQPAAAALSVANTEFAKEIEKRTNGQVQITVYQGGSLLSGPAMYEGIRSGIADMGNCITVYNPGAFPFTSIAELPSPAESGWVSSHAQYDFLEKYQPKEWAEVHILTTVSDSFNIGAVAMARTPILKLEDWKGKTLRVVNPKEVTALGGTVKDVPMADVYDALSKGVIDGEVGNAEPLKAWRLADVAKHITVTAGVVQPSILWYNIMNKDKWNSLPPDIQKTITDVGREYSGKLGSAWDDQMIAGIEYAKSVGCTIYMLSKDEAVRWTAAIMPVIDAHLKNLTTKGFTQRQVEDAWEYFKGRLEYWNGQQSRNNVVPTRVRVEELMK